MQDTLRKAHLGLLREVLEGQNARKIDIVAKASTFGITMFGVDGENVDPQLVQRTDAQHIDEFGVTEIGGLYTPTDVFDEGLSDKLKIPLAYLRRLRTEHHSLYAENVNQWLERTPNKPYLLRLFSRNEGYGVARAILSDRFRVVDNLDVLVTVLDGLRDMGVEVRVHSADLSERRMTVRIYSEQIRAMAPTLLRGYRSPFTGMTGEENPIVFAGMRISNSETGGGAFTITPELRVQVCDNGMVVSKNALREVHLGGRLEPGIVQWSDETQQRQLELIRSKTKDAVATFMDKDYVEDTLRVVEARAAVKLDKPEQDVREITKAAGFTQEQQDEIFGYFVQGGQMTRGGVYNAATAWVQEVENPDTAHTADLQIASILGL